MMAVSLHTKVLLHMSIQLKKNNCNKSTYQYVLNYYHSMTYFSFKINKHILRSQNDRLACGCKYWQLTKKFNLKKHILLLVEQVKHICELIFKDVLKEETGKEKSCK